MKTCYTAIFGNYDDLKEPRVVTPGWEYVCFTDNRFLKSKTWKIVLTDIDTHPQRAARFYKLLFYSGLGERTIWVDASFTINCNLDVFWDANFQSPFTAPKHPIRSCVYEEAEACIRNKRADELTVRKQIDKYAKLKVPERNGMISSGILMRENTEQVQYFCNKWWIELCENSLRDQISFGRVDFEYPGVVKTFKWDYRDNLDFLFNTHLNKRHRSYRVRKRGHSVRYTRRKNIS